MSNLEMKLSAEGMKNIPLELLQNDFAFVVGSKTYQCPRLIATFLSPKVARYCKQDPTISEYCLETEDRRNQFPDFLSLGYGSSIVVTEENRRYLLSVARELENTDLHFSILSQMEEGLSVEKVCALGGSDPVFFETLSDNGIGFLASHLWALDWPTLNNIPLSILFDIFEHPSLRIQTENWLYYLLFYQLSRGREYFRLFRFVVFPHTVAFVRRHFLELAHDYPEYFETTLDAIKGLAEAVKPKEDPGRYKMIDDYCPIFERLATSFQGNRHEAGIVTVTTKSNSGADWSHPRNIADLDLKTGFESADEQNQWICCDFHDLRVALEKFTWYSW
jgi:hypothetical protein